MSHGHTHPPHLHSSHDDSGKPTKHGINAEMIVAFAAIFLSVCGLVVSIYEANLERHFHRAQVWPRLQVTTSNARGFQFQVSNAGIGPAVIEQVSLSIDGTPMTDWAGAVLKLTGETPHGATMSTLGMRVIRPGEVVDVLSLPADSVLIPRLFAALGKVGMQICYRSVFDERFLLVMPPGDAEPRIDEVKTCPQGAKTRF